MRTEKEEGKWETQKQSERGQRMERGGRKKVTERERENRVSLRKR